MRIQLLLFFSMLFAATVGSAGDKEDARSAFERGKTLYGQLEYEEATKAFREAYRLRPSWVLLFNIGQCSAAAKKYGLALESFESYLSKGGDEVPLERRDEVISEIRALRELVGYLDIEAPEGALISVDGFERGRFPLPGPVLVSAGSNHEVVVSKDGDTLYTKTIRISSGSTMELRVSVTAEPSAEAAPSPPSGEISTVQKDTPPEKEGKRLYSKPLRVAGWASVGVGVGLLVGGIVTGVLTYSANKDLNARNCIGDECNDDIDKVDKLQLTTNLLLGDGGGIAAAGVTILIISYVSEKRKKQRNNVSLVPAFHTGQVGLLLSRDF